VLVGEVAAQSRTSTGTVLTDVRTGLLRDLITEKSTGNNKPSATVQAFTLVANEPDT